MPTPTYIPLATYTVTGSPDAEVVFSSIPATYRDLILVIDATIPTVAGHFVRVNGDTGTNYSRVYMINSGSSPLSGADTLNRLAGGNVRTSKTTLLWQFMDYSATDKHKTVLHRYSNAPDEVFAIAHRWANTAAIHTITMFPDSTSYNVGSTFSLYGIH